MGKHVVVGAGQVGAELARELVRRGHEVVIVSRSGSGPELAGVRRVAADAGDRERLAAIAEGAETLYNCVNPKYHRWMPDWPPMAAALLGAAEDTGAGYVILGSLYGYGPVDGPMTERTPLKPSSEKAEVRVAMWRDALAAHEAGRVRVTEVRGSDFYGPGCRDQSHLGDRFIPRLLAGKAVRLTGDPDQPHSWTYVPDVAAALAIAGTDERAYGRAWHIPTAPPASYRELAERVCAMAGLPAPRVGGLPQWLLDMLGVVNPMMGEIKHVRYQFDHPFVIDSTDFQQTFGMRPTPIDEGLRATLEWWRGQERTAAA
ncbi:nucleoside-diphosphate-sugar epimerase [Thermocatellispora tengchongensis]|uniref:Nucleoside-diphosphate-sugar epimerase n=1 Tax=Thermocatellispora tengchongensis TaxID=1073253 RepID=A0A840P214_9ACTN|nr:NAD-dependent epimerase/dehydratase family protein [Thermocatellispora tengchongensis]MBB5133029.1 nucleoside-diphosphate-sugar epimerase [Thermocatellispora tengchongensis]